MSKDKIIISEALVRFLDLFAEHIPTYSTNDMKRILKGYVTLGYGAITVALYNPDLRKKYDSKIILISQDYLKVFFAYIHARYPQCKHFPEISLLAKTSYFPTDATKPVGVDTDKTSFVYCVPEYWSVLYDSRKKEWYRIRSDKTLYTDSSFWGTLKKKDFFKIGDSFFGNDKKVIEQLNFLLDFFTQFKGKRPNEKTLSYLEKIDINKDTESIRQALVDLTKSAIRLSKNMYWDADMRQDSPNMQRGMKNLYLFRNVAVDNLIDNAILLDVLF